MDERIRVHSVETFMRRGELGQPPRLVDSQVWHVLPWARGFDEQRYQQLLKVEQRLEHPMLANPDEFRVNASAPAQPLFHVIEAPVAGLTPRLFLARN